MKIYLDDRTLTVERGTTVAAAMLNAGVSVFRESVSGEPRAPLCGMGVCYECMVTIDGQRELSCQTLCQEGMRILTR
ncbi:MAG: (2Fe-2S)-binding protein [Bryobacterales bacterium]|nr:(2Fe-2S)-binding protein [Bryobacterales bacterium]